MRSCAGTSLCVFACIVNFFSRRLNAHLSSIVSSKPFQMPVEVISRTTALGGSRLSSFGYSGTIAHGAFEARKPVLSGSPRDSKTFYRNKSLLIRSKDHDSFTRRIALGRPRKHDVSSQIPQLAAYYRETVLSGRLVQSATSQ